MSESDEPKRRPRWFQFDLRLLFVLIAVIGAVLAITVATRARKAERKLLETLAVGDSVHVLRAEGGSVTIHYGSVLVRGSVGTITEIGEDFVTIRIEEEDTEHVIPLSRISRVLREIPATSPVAKTRPPRKASPETSDPEHRATREPVMRKSNELSP
jgi:preprotein translocase subunit YajC